MSNNFLLHKFIGYYSPLEVGALHEMDIVNENRWIVDENKLLLLLGSKCHRSNCDELIDENSVTIKVCLI